MIPVQQYTFQIPAGGAFPLQAMGRYYRIQSASGALKVVGDNFGNMGLVGPGQGYRMREKDVPFQRLTFIDVSGAANNVVVVVADADFVDNTVLGTVSMIDGGKARTLALQTYSIGGSVSGVAAQFSAVQFYCATPGVRAVVSQITVQSTQADGLAIAPSAGGYLTTLVGSARNKRVGGAGSTASGLRTQTVGAVPPVIAVSPPYFQVNVPASGSYTYRLTEPIVIPGAANGVGIVVYASTAANSIGASFEFYEEPDA